MQEARDEVLSEYRKEGRAGKEPIREQNCIRCGRCLEVCPMRLMPTMLVRYAKAGLYDYCQKYHIDYCSGCGACAYVCPAKIPLLRYINIAKRELTQGSS
jgi:electron transport complex protein RnfC